MKGFTISASIRSPELSWIGAQESIKECTNSAKTITEVAMKIFRKLWKVNSVNLDVRIDPIRSLRVAVSNLTTDTRVQLSLFHDGGAEDKNDKVSAVFDKVRRKYGTHSLFYGTLLGSEFNMHFEVLDKAY
jgi:hypothetical protein